MYEDIIRRYAADYMVPEVWIKAVISTESDGNPYAIRNEPTIGDASYGLMQILYRTAIGLGYGGTPEGLFDPDTNIRLGTSLLQQLRQSYGDDVQRVYSAYNSGKPDSYLTSPAVRAHVQRFMDRLEDIIQAEPVIAAAGSFGLVITLLLMWYYKTTRS